MGKPTKLIPKLTQEEINRFWSKVDCSNGLDTCWKWQGSTKGNKGYGKIRLHPFGHFRVHRIAYYLHYKKDPGELCVCHTCDHPSCCNPKHLWLGTHTDNMHDKIRKRRQRHFKGEEHPDARLTEKDVIEILNSNDTYKNIAKQYNITMGHVSGIRTGKYWKHMGNRDHIPKRPRAKLTEANIKVIRVSQETNTTLSKQFNVSSRTIRRIRRQETWQHVT